MMWTGCNFESSCRQKTFSLAQRTEAGQEVW